MQGEKKGGRQGTESMVATPGPATRGTRDGKSDIEWTVPPGEVGRRVHRDHRNVFRAYT